MPRDGTSLRPARLSRRRRAPSRRASTSKAPVSGPTTPTFEDLAKEVILLVQLGVEVREVVAEHVQVLPQSGVVGHFWSGLGHGAVRSDRRASASKSPVLGPTMPGLEDLPKGVKLLVQPGV